MKKSIMRVLIIVPLILFGIYVFTREISHLNVLRQENERIKGNIARIEAENDGLTKKISAVKGDKVYMEKVAREELGMIKQGEKIYKFGE